MATLDDTKRTQPDSIHGCFIHKQPAHPGCLDCYVMVTAYGDQAETLLLQVDRVLQRTLECLLHPVRVEVVDGVRTVTELPSITDPGERKRIFWAQLTAEKLPAPIIQMALRWFAATDERVRREQS